MALVTLWFVNTEHPREVLAGHPAADRGFARKLLAQLNPKWPRVHIGDFDMLRSATPGAMEFYIGGYPGGLSVVQVSIPGLVRLSELPAQVRNRIPAEHVYATAVAHPVAEPHALVLGDGTALGQVAGSAPELEVELDATFGAFAHWHGNDLRRAFAATRSTVFEDEGLPEPIESRFWEGTLDSTGIELPFIPQELACDIAEYWLGFPVSSTPGPFGQQTPLIDIPVAAFAIDDRAEVKQVVDADRGVPGPADSARLVAGAGSDSGSGSGSGEDYDDYADAQQTTTKLEETMKKMATRATTVLHGGLGAAREQAQGAIAKAISRWRSK